MRPVLTGEGVTRHEASDEAPPVHPGDWSLGDVRRVAEGALVVAGGLLSAGERVMAARLAALSGPEGRLWARMAGRQGEIFRLDHLVYSDVPDVEAAVDALVALDLAQRAVSPRQAAEAFTVAELKEVCRAQGLPLGGRREQLIERLAARRGWLRVSVVRVACKGLLRRLELLWFRDRWRDRSAFLLERLGHARWARYDLTPAEPPFLSRGELLRFEEAARLVAGERPPEALLDELRACPARPAQHRALDRRRLLTRVVLEEARSLERLGEPGRAVALYEAVLGLGFAAPGPVAARLALALEAEGRPALGAARCAEVWERADAASRLSLERTGRRLARRAGGHWRSTPPLRAAPERTIWLKRAPGEGPRPLWLDEALTVEAAVATALRPRLALHGENLVWTTLFGLIFAELYFMPVHGALPVPTLDGPLDLGTPAFARRRAEALAARLQRVRDGEGPRIIAEVWAARHGERLAGVSWELAEVEALQGIAAGVGGSGLALILERLAAEGWSAARGLPDLVIAPGEAVELAQAIPATVAPGLLLAEVKGPGDSLRDEQHAWHDLLVRAGVPCEVWRVKEA